MLRIAPILLSIVAISVLVATGVVLFLNATNSKKRQMGVVAALTFGSSAFALAYLLGEILAHLSVNGAIIDALMEESLKSIAIILVIRVAKPVAVTASFGAIEVISKYHSLFLIASPFRSMVVETHLAYVLLGMVGAYVMHLATGVFYEKLGMRLGFVSSLSAHFAYNSLGYQLDNYAQAFDGVMLLLVSAMLMGAARYSDDFLSMFRNSHDDHARSP